MDGAAIQLKMTRKKTVARRRKKLQASSGGEAPALVRSSSSASAGGTQPQEVLSLRDAETIRLCKQALEAEDLTRIRELACSRGLVNRELRMRCWPLLLGLLPDRQGLLPAPAPSHPPTPLPLSATTASSSRGSSDEGNHCSSSSHGNVQQGLQGGGEGQVHAPGSLDARQSQKSKAVQSQCTCTQQHSLRQQSGAAGNEEDGTVRQGGLVWEEDGELELELEGEEEGGGQGMRADEGCTASTSGVGGVSKQQYEAWHRQGHRDSHVVAVDVVRSLWSFTPGMSDERRQVWRDQLQRMLDAAVSRHSGLDPQHHVFYYQGLHDVASVLLLELGGEARAFPLLCKLVTCQLRDCTRPSLEPVLELLQLLWPLLQHTDKELAQTLTSLGMPPYFALSWYITWFAHDVSDLKTAARLFDLFLPSHPLMPLYVGAVAMRCVRERLLGCGEMHEAHSLLSKLDFKGDGLPPLEQIIQGALALFDKAPPTALLLGLGRDVGPLRMAVSPWASLQDGIWIVPDTPGPMPTYPQQMRGLQIFLSGLSLPLPLGWRLRRTGSDGGGVGGSVGSSPRGAGASDPRKRPRSRPLVVLSLGGMLSVYVVAVVLGYTVLRSSSGAPGMV